MRFVSRAEAKPLRKIGARSSTCPFTEITFSLINSHSNSDNMVVIPKDITLLATGQLFASDECGHLWTAKLDILKRAKTPHYFEIKVQFIADLLGTSTALTVDPNGSLYYYLPRDGALVRWNSRFDANYELLTQEMTHFGVSFVFSEHP